MTAAKASTRKVTDFIPDDQNANKGTLRGLAMLEDSLQELGAGRSILVDKNNRVIAGNKTQQAAIDAGMSDAIVVPTDGKQLVVVQRVDIDLDSPRGRKLAILDNRTSEVSLDWDADVLRALQDDGVDLSALWDADELTALLGATDEQPGDPGAQMDKAAELQAKWNVRKGDLWTIGKHRLLCGDSTDAADVARVMGNVKANLLLADPPYGVKMDKGFEGFGGFGTPIARRQYSDDWDSERPTKATFDLVLQHAEIAIIFGGNFFADLLPRSTHWIVWDKNNTMPTFGDCELAWTNIGRKSVKKFTFEYNGLIGKEKERLHPTQKPAGLFADIIQEYTDKDATVLDPFSGSGTTLVACEQTGRQGRAIEIEPKYVAVALERLAAMGLAPERAEA